MPRSNIIGQRSSIIGRRSIIGQRVAVGRRARMAVGQGGAPNPFAGFDPTVYNVEQSAASAARRVTQGFFQAAVAAGGQATIQANPQYEFRPDRLIVPSPIAPFFTLDNFIIGNRPQNVAANPASCECFTEDAVGVGLLCDTAQPGVLVQLVVTNISGGPLDFRATIFGAAIFGTP